MNHLFALLMLAIVLIGCPQVTNGGSMENNSENNSEYVKEEKHEEKKEENQEENKDLSYELIGEWKVEDNNYFGNTYIFTDKKENSKNIVYAYMGKAKYPEGLRIITDYDYDYTLYALKGTYSANGEKLNIEFTQCLEENSWKDFSDADENSILPDVEKLICKDAPYSLIQKEGKNVLTIPFNINCEGKTVNCYSDFKETENRLLGNWHRSSCHKYQPEFNFTLNDDNTFTEGSSNGTYNVVIVHEDNPLKVGYIVFYDSDSETGIRIRNFILNDFKKFVWYVKEGVKKDILFIRDGIFISKDYVKEKLKRKEPDGYGQVCGEEFMYSHVNFYDSIFNEEIFSRPEE